MAEQIKLLPAHVDTSVAAIHAQLTEALERSPHLRADLGYITREEAYRLDPVGPVRIVDYIDLIR